jgi:radical SAM protein with 4Fe4S-binding SPASM domain
MRGTLPGHARWVAERENHTACLLLAIALQIYHDGRVSACACCDYNASPELALGSMKESALLELFNSPKNQLIWSAHQSGNLPRICQHCSFHSAMSALSPEHSALTKITNFIGG